MKIFLRRLLTRRSRSACYSAPLGTSLNLRWRPLVVRLEDRMVPATVITILDGGVGTLDGFLSPTDGTILAGDGGAVPGSVSRAALQGVNPNVNIIIQASDAVVVSDLTSPLALQTTSAFSARFEAQGTSISFTDTSDSLTTAGGSFQLVAPTAATLGGLTSSGGDISINADNMALNQSIIAGSGRVALAPFTALNSIDLGGADGAGVLGLTDAELDLVTAGVLVIGNATNAGKISVSAAVDTSGTTQLELETGANVFSNGGSITEVKLAITADQAIGAVANQLKTSVSSLEAFTNSGGIFIDNSGPILTIGGVNGTLSGVDTTQNSIVITNTSAFTVSEGISIAGTTGSISLANTSSDINVDAAIANNSPTGNVTITAEDNVNVTQPISTAGSGSISITAEPANAAGSFKSSGAGTLTTNNGDIKVQAADNVDVGAAILAGGTGSITIIAEPTTGNSAAAGNFTNSGTGTVSTNNGAILIQAGDGITVGAAVTAGGSGAITIEADAAIDNIGNFAVNPTGSLATSGGQITATAFDIDLIGTVNATTANFANVTLQPRQNNAVISLGTNSGFGLTDADLDQITARSITLGNSSHTAGIQLTGQVSIDPLKVLTLVLNDSGAGGSITDNTAGEQTDVTVQNLLLIADSGVGTVGDDLDIAVSNLAVRNVNMTAGAINIVNDSTLLNISSAGNDFSTLFGVINSNATSGTGTVAIATAGSMNIQTFVQASGVNDVTLDVGNSVTLSANSKLQSGDDSAGGNITVRVNIGSAAGTEDMVLGANANILTMGNITFDADPDGNGTGGAITMDATSLLAGPAGELAQDIKLRAGEDISLSSVKANGLVDITTSAGITDDGNDTSYVSGASVNLTAGGNIGATTQIGRDDVLLQNSAFQQAIDFDLTAGTLTIAQTGAGGNIQLRLVDGSFTSTIFTGATYPTPAGVGNQLALIASGGDIGGTAPGNMTVNSDLTLASGNDVNLLLAATDGNDVVIGVAANGMMTNNGANGTVTVVSEGGGGITTNLAITSGGSISLTSASNTDGVFIGDDITATGAGSTIIVDSGIGIAITSVTAVISTTNAAGGAVTFSSARDLPNFNTAGAGGIFMTGGSEISTAANNSAILLQAGQVVLEGDDITVSKLDAGAGDVDLVAADGAVIDGNGALTNNISGGIVGFVAHGAAGIDSDVNAVTRISAFTSNDPISLRSPAIMPIQQINAGTANVNLSAGGIATGIIRSISPNDNVADVIGGTVVLNATGPTNGNTGQIGFFSATAQFFEIDADFLTATTSDSRIWISEVGTGASAGVSIDNVNAGTNSAFLRVRNGGSIVSTSVDDTPDIVAAAVNLSAPEGGNFGTSLASPLEINTGTLTANVQVAAGSISVRDTSAGMVVAAAQTFDGNINLETKGAGSDLSTTLVNAGGTGSVVLNAADDLNIGAASGVTAGGTITAAIDVGNLVPGTGSTALVAGTISATSMTLTGNVDSDVFNITPSATTPISVDGDNPVPPALPGDSLNVDVTGATGINFTKVASPNGFSGSYAFTNRLTVNYQEIESLSPDGVDLSILMSDVPDPVVAGQTITYTVTVNIGNAEGQNVQVLDSIPANTTFTSFTAPAGWTIITPPVGGTGNVTATRPTLAGGSAAQVFTLVVRVNSSTANSTIINNSVTVSSSTNELDPNNNSAATATTVKAVILPVVTGADAGGGSHVKVFDPITGTESMSFFAYPGFGGGVRVAAGDVSGDGIADVITGAGPGGGPHVKAFDGVTGAEIRSFFAYAAGFRGGVYVAVGDVNNDGFGDIITGAGAGGGPHVIAYSGKDGSLLQSYFAYDAAFAGGVRVAAGYVDSDADADIITGAGPGGGPHVTVRSGADLTLLRSFFAYDATVSTGVYVAGGDLNNDGRADIITGTGTGSTPHTIVFSGLDNSVLESFFAYDASFIGGVRVGVADFGGDGLLDLVTGAGPSGGPHVKVFEGVTQTELASFFAYDPSFLGGIFVG